jgi:serine kinase
MLITDNFNIRVADFGFVCRTTNSSNNNERVMSRTFCGSLAYAAPELVRGDPYDARLSDAWSLGVILFVMFNASMPFDDSDMKQMLLDQEARHWRLAKDVKNRVSKSGYHVSRTRSTGDRTLFFYMTRHSSDNYLDLYLEFRTGFL